MLIEEAIKLGYMKAVKDIYFNIEDVYM